MTAGLLEVMAVDGGTLVLLSTIAFVVAVVGGMSGMGGGLIVSIFVAPLVGVQALVPTIGLAMLIAHVARVLVYRRDILWREAALVVAVAVPAAIAGSMLYASLTSNAIGTVLGFFLIATVPLRRFMQRHEFRLPAPGLMACSAAAGCSSSPC